jgi:hypothetical protein
MPMIRQVLYNILIECGIAMKRTVFKMCLIVMYSKVHIGKLMSDAFLIQNCMIQWGALSPFSFNFPLEYQETEEVLELNEAHYLVFCSDNIHSLGTNKYHREKHTEAILNDRNANKSHRLSGGPEVNAE